MARRLKDRASRRSEAERPLPDPARPPGAGPPANGADPRRTRVVLACAAIAAALWLLGLGLLALLTANPVTINREQVLKADAVIVGEVSASNEVRVVRIWSQRRPVAAETLRLDNLAESKARVGERYLIPVSRTATGFQIAPTALPGQVPLIYPHTDEADKQLRRVLPPAE